MNSIKSQSHSIIALDQAVIFPPSDKSSIEAVAVINDAVRAKSGNSLPVIKNISDLECHHGKLVIALGCMVDNPLIREKYYKFKTLVDRWYPGSGGYLLQTIHPLGDEGPRVLIVGGSNEQGVLLAARTLADKINSSTDGMLDWQLDVQLGSQHLPLPEDKIDALGTGASTIFRPENEVPSSPFQSGYKGGSIQNFLLSLGMFGPHADNSHFSRSSEFALRYLYTGNRDDGILYKKTLLEEIQLGIIRKLYHYKSIRMFQLWETLRPSPIFAEQDRITIDEAILDYLMNESGVATIERTKREAITTQIFDRHCACDTLNLYIGSDYFYRLTNDDKWLCYREIAEDYFQKQYGVDIPITGLTEGYASYLEVYLEWMLNSCPEKIKENKHIKLWAERICGLITNSGHLIQGAQTESHRFSYNLLRRLAFLLNDGRYLYICDLREREFKKGTERILQFSAGQAYAGDIKPIEPSGVNKITVFPLNERLRQWKVPEISAEKGFDRIIARGGWSENNDYWAIAGVLGAGKTLPIVGALAAYESLGTTHIISPAYALHAKENLPSGYSAVTVTQNGLNSGVHKAAVVTGQWQEQGIEIISIKTRADDAYDWLRTFVWKPNEFLLIADKVIIRKEGDFTVSSNWRCARPMVVSGSTAYSDFQSTEGDKYRFHIESTSSSMTYESHPQCPVDKVDTNTVDWPVIHTIEDGSFKNKPYVETGTLLHVAPLESERFSIKQNDDLFCIEDCEKAYVIKNLNDEINPPIVEIKKPGNVTPIPAKTNSIFPTMRDGSIHSCFSLEIGQMKPRVIADSSNSKLLAVAGNEGECFVFNGNGDCLFTLKHESVVTAMTFWEDSLITGTKNGVISRFSPNGELHWRCQCEFREERSLWSWWFLSTPYIGSLAAAKDPVTGKSYVATGTGSCALNILDADTGELITDVLCHYGLMEKMIPHFYAKLNQLRFLAAHSNFTCGSTVAAWTLSGSYKERTDYNAPFGLNDKRSPGWDMCAVADFKINNDGENDCLALLRYGSCNELSLYNLETTEPKWMNQLGGAPFALEILTVDNGDTPVFVTAERYGWISQFNTSGKAIEAFKISNHLTGMASDSRGTLFYWNDEQMFAGNSRHELFSTRLEGKPIAWVKLGGAEGLLTYQNNTLKIGTIKNG